jgi:hypothetical protein
MLRRAGKFCKLRAWSELRQSRLRNSVECQVIRPIVNDSMEPDRSRVTRPLERSACSDAKVISELASLIIETCDPHNQFVLGIAVCRPSSTEFLPAARMCRKHWANVQFFLAFVLCFLRCHVDRQTSAVASDPHLNYGALSPFELGDEEDLAAGADRLEIGGLVDLTVDGDGGFFFEVVA